MKILKIEFRNINSLKGDHEIDFTTQPFTASSLFAITGPTGSGKSTILDVISLALFNNIPRLDKVSKGEITRTGAILTRNQKDAMAAVTYQGKNGQYRSQWSISTARTGSLREYEMQLGNMRTGELLDLKKSEIPGKNEELIGLNYNQFIKSVLLAQGEFAQFLKAKKEERGELLEKITGTGIYRLLGKRAFEKHKTVNQAIQKQQDAIEVNEQELLHEDQRLAYTRELEEKETNCASLEKELEVLVKNLEVKKTIAHQQKDIASLTAEKKLTDIRWKEFDTEFGLRLFQHEKLRDYAEQLRYWKRLRTEGSTLEKDVAEKTKKRDENLQRLGEFLHEISDFTGMQTTSTQVASNLELFSAKVRKLQNDVHEKLIEFKSLQRQFISETRELTCKLDDRNPSDTQKQLEKLKSSSLENIRYLTPLLQDVNVKEVENEKRRLRKYLDDAQEARNHSEKIKQFSNEIIRLTGEQDKLNAELQKLPLEIRHSQDQVNLFQERMKTITLKKQNQLLLASFEKHRASLQQGAPCPLCGSEDHPYAENLPKENDQLEKLLKETEETLKAWNTKLTRHTTTQHHVEEQLTKCTAQKDSIAKELNTKQLAFLDQYRHLSAEKETDWKTVIAQYQSKLDHLEQYVKEVARLHCVEVGLPLIKQIITLSEQGKELRDNLVSVYEGPDIHRDTQLLHTGWTQMKAQDKTLTEQLGELHKKLKEIREQFQTLAKELDHKVREEGFQTTAEAENALLPDPEYFRLQSARDKLDREIAKNQHSLKLLTSQLEKSRKEDVGQTTEELMLKRQEQHAILEQRREHCQHLKRQLLNDQERRNRIQELKNQIAEKEKEIIRWRLLNELIGDAQGKKFNDFAQDLSLTQLLRLANIRLADLSDRYKIDKSRNEEDDGLVAIDEHMGGQRRSVKTLSGGETFILSLSMALALSDLASKNVEINSLFIDEGFGTLDPETLDQTLDTLEKLQAESSKLIGIISHVDSLKERIATQIQLKRNGQGYSTLEVVH